MRRSTNIGQRSIKKKKPLIQRISHFAIFLSILVVFLFMIHAVVLNLISMVRLNGEKKELLENHLMVQALEKQLEYSQTPEFIEQYARENLDMLKSGEFVIIVHNE